MRQHICNPYLFPINNCEGADALIGLYHIHFTLLAILEEDQRGAPFSPFFSTFMEYSKINCFKYIQIRYWMNRSSTFSWVF